MIKHPLSFLAIVTMSKEEIPHLYINYTLIESQFGSLIIASTSKGICYLAFIEEEMLAIQTLKGLFPKAQFQCQSDTFQEGVMYFFKGEKTTLQVIPLHIKGTPFQLKVWDFLLEIPFGELSNYGEIAQQIGHSKASRAVGTAIGSNPIALLIPCHRVVQANGKLGGFKWGLERKAAIIAWEASYQD